MKADSEGDDDILRRLRIEEDTLHSSHTHNKQPRLSVTAPNMTCLNVTFHLDEPQLLLLLFDLPFFLHIKIGQIEEGSLL